MGLWNAGKRQTNGGAPRRPHTAPAHQRLRNRNRKGKEAEDAIQRQEDVELQQLGRENHYGNVWKTDHFNYCSRLCVGSSTVCMLLVGERYLLSACDLWLLFF